MSDNNKIAWTTVKKRLGDITPWGKNPRQLSKHDAENIRQSLETFGLADPLIVNADNTMIGGHQRQNVIGDDDLMVDVRVPSRQLTDREVEELNVRLNRNAGEWDFDILANQFEVDDLLDWGFTEYDLHMNEVMIPDFQPVDESEQPRLDQKKPVTCPECGNEFQPS